MGWIKMGMEKQLAKLIWRSKNNLLHLWKLKSYENK